MRLIFLISFLPWKRWDSFQPAIESKKSPSWHWESCGLFVISLKCTVHPRKLNIIFHPPPFCASKNDSCSRGVFSKSCLKPFRIFFGISPFTFFWQPPLGCTTRAYSLFFLVGTFGAIQIPVVGMQPLRSLDAPANNQGVTTRVPWDPWGPKF